MTPEEKQKHADGYLQALREKLEKGEATPTEVLDLQDRERVKEDFQNCDLASLFTQREEKPRFSELSFCDLFLKEHKLICLKDTEELLIFDPVSGLWQERAEQVITSSLEFVFRKMGHALHSNTVETVLLNLRARSYLSREVFDAKPEYLLPLRNGVFNHNTKQLEPYRNEFYFTSCLPVYYNPSATCPQIDKFFSEIVAPEDVPLLTETFAHCIEPGNKKQIAEMLIGSGSNGKSTYLNLLSAFLGRENVSAVPLQSLETQRFATSSLYAKRANIAADIPSSFLSSSGSFKQLTGGDKIPAEKKFKDSFSFVNQAKLIFSCNEAPAFSDDSDALYRRWLVITFPNQFDGAQKNDDLPDVLTRPEELSGLLNKVLGVYSTFQVLGFSRTESIAQKRETYKSLADSVYSFAQLCHETETDEWHSSDWIFNQYLAFCAGRKVVGRPKDKFFRFLRQHCPFLIPSRPKVDGKRETGYYIQIDPLPPPCQGGQAGQPSYYLRQKNNILEVNNNHPDQPDKAVQKTLLSAETPKNPSTWSEEEQAPVLRLLPGAIRQLLKDGAQKTEVILSRLREAYPFLTSEQMDGALSSLRSNGDIHEPKVGVLALVA